jgi:hypothetical protein
MNYEKIYIKKLFEVTGSANFADLEKKANSEWKQIIENNLTATESRFNKIFFEDKIPLLVAYQIYLEVKRRNKLVISQFNVNCLEKSMELLLEKKNNDHLQLKTPILSILHYLSSQLLNNFKSKQEELIEKLNHLNQEDNCILNSFSDLNDLVDALEYLSLYENY